MLWVIHASSLHVVPSGDEQSYQVHYHGGSGQEACVQCMMDSGTLQPEGGGDTLVPCRDNGGRLGETESGVSEVNVHPTERDKMK